MSWNHGYVSEIDYTHGYYRELSPLTLELCLLSKAYAHRLGRPLRYLELGFGQGLSLNIHAAAMDGDFWGTDFNPSQAANARDLADASGGNVTILDDSFEELAARNDLPEFDVIALHGIWSWISEANRRIIVDIARRKLAVGGVFYISYNCTPGWSAAMPLRHLMTLHADLASGEAQGITNRIDSALNFAHRVVESNAMYFKANPAVADRLKKIREQNRSYLAHEYFNADWHPMPFSEVADMLSGAKLSFAASASLLEHIDAINLSAESQKLLSEISHPILRESVRDYCINQQFRRDIFIKGMRPLPPFKQAELLQNRKFVLAKHPTEIPTTVTGAAGEATLQEEIYQPLIAALADNGFQPKSVQELSAHGDLKNIKLSLVVQALFVLAGAGHVYPVQSEEDARAASARTDALNAHLFERAVYSGDVGFIASPLTGGGVAVGRFQQLFLRAIKAGKATPPEWAAEASRLIHGQGQLLQKEGKTIQTLEATIAELTTEAIEFGERRLPLLKALMIA